MLQVLDVDLDYLIDDSQAPKMHGPLGAGIEGAGLEGELLAGETRHTLPVSNWLEQVLDLT